MSLEWLNQHVVAFGALSEEAKAALMEFSFLWSLFEYEVLAKQGNVPALRNAAHQWSTADLLNLDMFADDLAYFRARYYENGEFTYRFPHLHLEKSGNPKIVRDVLSGQTNQSEDVCVALLIIVFRYRNNFLHGEKWHYGLQEQEQNFARANRILQTAISLHRTLLALPVA
jgi:hypothetical protein